MAILKYCFRRNMSCKKRYEMLAGTSGMKFREILNKELKEPQFKAEWEALEPEQQNIVAWLESQMEKNPPHTE